MRCQNQPSTYWRAMNVFSCESADRWGTQRVADSFSVSSPMGGVMTFEYMGIYYIGYILNQKTHRANTPPFLCALFLSPSQLQRKDLSVFCSCMCIICQRLARGHSTERGDEVPAVSRRHRRRRRRQTRTRRQTTHPNSSGGGGGGGGPYPCGRTEPRSPLINPRKQR